MRLATRPRPPEFIGRSNGQLDSLLRQGRRLTFWTIACLTVHCTSAYRQPTNPDFDSGVGPRRPEG
jgi:hypothetical protein